MKTHTEQALDPVNLPGQYNITVEGTTTNAAEHPITIGSIDVAMATSLSIGNGALRGPTCRASGSECASWGKTWSS